jgi:hypothetical protein
VYFPRTESDCLKQVLHVFPPNGIRLKGVLRVFPQYGVRLS